ncbi:hypothetical protein [Pyrobaculum sp.]|uniref:hypothetical protein n=1 Tax=Pyrobaculum sp. TaxID=2004705 RepID=UPI003D0E0D5C
MVYIYLGRVVLNGESGYAWLIASGGGGAGRLARFYVYFRNSRGKTRYLGARTYEEVGAMFGWRRLFEATTGDYKKAWLPPTWREFLARLARIAFKTEEGRAVLEQIKKYSPELLLALDLDEYYYGAEELAEAVEKVLELGISLPVFTVGAFKSGGKRSARDKPQERRGRPSSARLP